MKNKMIKGLVALGMLLAGLTVVNTGSNVDTVQASCNWWRPEPHCVSGGSSSPGSGSPGSGGGQIPELQQPGMRPHTIEIDFSE